MPAHVVGTRDQTLLRTIGQTVDGSPKPGEDSDGDSREPSLQPQPISKDVACWLCGPEGEMTHGDDCQFHTGQLVWVVEPDGSRRPAEYVGQGESPRRPPEALVIYVDWPGPDVVVTERLQSREARPAAS